MKNKTLIISVLTLAVFALVGVGVVSAQGRFSRQNIDPAQVVERQQSQFEHQAEMLGISSDQIKDYWSQGKNMRDIIEELDLDQTEIKNKMQAQRQEKMQQHLQDLVDQGVITQEQANNRLEFMANHQPGERGMRGSGGFKGHRDCPMME